MRATLSLTKRMRHLGAYDGGQIDELAQHFLGLTEIEATSWQIKLPHYAIEALLDAGLLVWEDHPAVRTVRPRVAIRSSSVIDFKARVQTAASATRPPPGGSTLLSAAKRIGGRRKPWAAIYRALLDGEMRFWLSGSGEVGPSHLLVQPEDILRFDHVSDEVLRPDLSRATAISKMDACEILNLTLRYFAPVERDFGLTFTQNGNAKTADFEDVLSIARQTVWPTELVKHLDLHANLLGDILPKFRIPRRGTGWCRKALIDQGILLSLPDDDHIRVAPDTSGTDDTRPQTRTEHIAIAAFYLGLRPFTRADVTHATELAARTAMRSDRGEATARAL